MALALELADFWLSASWGVQITLSPGGATLKSSTLEKPVLTLTLNPAGATLTSTGGANTLSNGLVVSPAGATLTSTGGTGTSLTSYNLNPAPAGATLTSTGGTATLTIFLQVITLSPAGAVMQFLGGVATLAPMPGKLAIAKVRTYPKLFAKIFDFQVE